ncbi:MAG: glycosyl transferase, partial [Pseudomonadota bacterium]
PDLIRTLITERSDMVVGTRRGVTDDAGRAGHAFGNKLFNSIYTTLFGSDFTDIFSGYRVFNQRFAKSFPALSGGFEIETEMSVHASMLRMPVSELTLDYGRRPEGSSSKLSTYKDGAKILWMLMMLMKETRPFIFFCAVSAAFLLASFGFMTPVLVEYFETGLVERLPTWIAGIALLMISILFFVSGVILDSLARSRAEYKRMLYMGLPTTRSPSRVVEKIQRRSRGKPRKSIAA